MINRLFRFNYIRNHYLRFGFHGILMYFQLAFKSKKSFIAIKLSEFKHSIFLRNQTSDIKTFYQVLFYSEYDLPFMTDPKIIIDLGANNGMASIFFLNKYPDAKVIAVEPEYENYRMLRENTENYNNFFSYNKGIWNRPANLEIIKSDLGNWAFFVKESELKTETTIDAITIRQIMDDHNISQIDILKIDIEGSEVELFSRNFEEWLGITKYIIIELHDWMRAGCAKQVFSALINYEFKLSIRKENLIIQLLN